MSNTAIVAAGDAPAGVPVLRAAELQAHVQVVQQAMAAVMKPGVHYGVPFTAKQRDDGDEDVDPRSAAARERSKNVLLKPGAEVLGMTFRIAPRYEIQTEDFDGGHVTFRVRCVGVHQVTGATLGEGLGEGSTLEEKYRWRRAVCEAEFDETPIDQRRAKWKGGRSKQWKVLQVEENPADKRNTVLKMACKRAHVAMILNVTAASDMFTQDLDDEIDGEATERDDGPARKKPGAKKKDDAPAATQKAATPEQNREAAKAKISARLADLKTTVAAACEACKVANFEALTKAEFEALWKYADEVEAARNVTVYSAGGNGGGGAGPDRISAQAGGGGASTQDFVDAMESAEKKGSAS